MMRRYQLLAKNGFRNIDSYNNKIKTETDKLPYYVIVIATQRPSINVITGVIKNNIPSRIAFQVASWIDSKTIIDTAGAEKLLGKGDMLFLTSGHPTAVRLQSPWISDEDVLELINFIKKQETANYDNNFINAMERLKLKKKKN